MQKFLINTLSLKIVVEVFNTISVIVGVVLLVIFEKFSHDKLWLCCTVQDESRCVLGATAVYEIAHEVPHIVVNYVSFTILS